MSKEKAWLPAKRIFVTAFVTWGFFFVV